MQPTAFSQTDLYKRFDAKIRMAVGRKLAADHQAFDELLQDIWLTVLQKMPDFDAQRGELGAFIHGITQKKIQHFLARRQVERRNRTVAIDPNIEKTYTELRDNPEARLLAKERKVHISRALNALDEKFRRILEMKYLEEKSYREIAAATGVDEARVKGRIHYAREVFRKTYEGMYDHKF
ncbi:MAG: RNA polymerase sigma factor [bacterium]